MTKYEMLYGVKVDHFPNEKQNVEEKLSLAVSRYSYVYINHEPSEEKEVLLHEINQAIKWCEKILRDINDE